MRKIPPCVDSSEIGMSANIVLITLQLGLLVFSTLGILSYLKMPVNLNQKWEQWGLLATVTITINRLFL